jgi:protein TonB
VGQIERKSQKEIKKVRKRSNFLPFLIASVLFHALLFLFVTLYVISPVNQQAKQKEKQKLIEITDLPVPKEKETAPPKEAKRFAERSHQTPQEKTKDEYTRKGNVMPRSRPQPKQQAKKVAKRNVEKQNKDISEKSTKVASLPKNIEKELSPLKEKSEEDKLASITKDQLFNAPSSQGLEQGSREFEGAGNVKQKEDTVDLNTVEYKYFSYFAKLKQKIEQVWNYPEASRLRGEQGELFLVFTIRRDGYLEDVKMITPSGYERLDEEALRAIRIASPFSPFPNSWALERLNVKATFKYEIRYGWTVR